MKVCKLSFSPAAVTSSATLNCDTPQFLDASHYRTLVGSLQYLTLTRPEIADSVNVVSQHMQGPIMADFAAVKRISTMLAYAVSK